jgi:hypothetical protein
MDEEILDLSGDQADGDAAIGIVEIITDVLIDMADADGLPQDDLEEVRLQMSEVATIILAELNFTVLSVDADGVVTATLDPRGLDV